MPFVTETRPSQPRLETARCIVRPAAPSDLCGLIGAVQSPLFPRRLPLAQFASSDELACWLERMCSRSAEGSAFLWSIDLKEGTHCIGQVSLSPKLDSNAWALAFWLHPTQWGHGFATETVSRVIESAFASLSIQELWAGVALWNQRSFIALERLGFHFLMNNASGYLVAGAPEPIREFHLTQQQWQCNEKLRNA